MTNNIFKAITLLGLISVFITFSCAVRHAPLSEPRRSRTMNVPEEESYKYKQSEEDHTEVEKTGPETSYPETLLTYRPPTPGPSPETEINVRKITRSHPEETIVIEQASIPPLLARFENTRKNPFLTRGRMALLLSAMPGIPMDEKSDVAIMTDIFNSPAKDSIISVVRSGYMRVFPNHQFKPEAIVTRAELADSISKLLSGSRISTTGMKGKINIPDLPSTNRYYLPVRHVVSVGVMTVREDGNFQTAEAVTGSEGWEIFLRLYNLIKNQKGQKMIDPQTGFIYYPNIRYSSQN